MSRKKKFTPTLVFGVLVASLVAFSLFDYKKAKKDAALGEHEEKLLTLSEGEVIEVAIHSKKLNLQLKSEDGNWHMIEPLKDDADDLAVVGLLNAIKDAKAQAVSDDSKKNSSIDWAQYGLAPGVDVEIKTDQGKQDTFKISDSNAYDGSFYVRKGDRLLVGDRGLARIVDLEVKNFRSHLIWRTKGEISRVEFKYTYLGEAKRAVLTKGEKEWNIEPKFDLPLSQQNVKDWLQSIHDLRALDFAANEISPKTMAQFGLTKPSMVSVFTVSQMGKNSSVTWTVGEGKSGTNEIFVMSSVLPEIFKSTQFSLRDVRIPAEQLLDGDQALVFPLEQALEVQVLVDGKAKKFTKGEKGWDKLVDFFQKLKGVGPIAADPPVGTVFDEKKNHLTVKNDSGVLLDLIWSDVKDQVRWLKISKFKERFKVSAERWNALIKATQ
jgi:hypothetical protein